MNRAALKRAVAYALLFLGIFVGATLTMFAAAWASMSWESAGDVSVWLRLAFSLAVSTAVLSLLRRESTPRHESQPG